MQTQNENTAVPDMHHRDTTIRFWESGRILDIRFDCVFKAVFTKETPESRGAISCLVSALIGKSITVDTIAANEPPIDDIANKRIRYDIACRSTTGERINIEMSLHPGPGELQRLEYYGTRSFIGQPIIGEKYATLKGTYQIAILAKDRFFDNSAIVHTFLYYDPVNQVSLNGKTRIITLELVKAAQVIDLPVEDMKNYELWATFIEYLTNVEKRSKIIEITRKEAGIAMAVETLAGITQDEDEWARLTTELKNRFDYINDVNSFRDAGREEGLQQGREEGLQQGLEQGHGEAMKAVARNALAKGLSMEYIHELTGLSLDEIAQLRV
jgi:predicted transposase/invertase (TIGR01784 family)